MSIADRLFTFLFRLIPGRNDLTPQLSFLFSRFIKLELSILVSCEMFFSSYSLKYTTFHRKNRQPILAKQKISVLIYLKEEAASDLHKYCFHLSGIDLADLLKFSDIVVFLKTDPVQRFPFSYYIYFVRSLCIGCLGLGGLGGSRLCRF